MPGILYGIKADEFSPGLLLVLDKDGRRVFDINGLLCWDVGEVYSEAFGVDVGGKRVESVRDEDDEGACCCDESVKWSDKWEVPSGGPTAELFA